jgi:hypothetical protein
MTHAPNRNPCEASFRMVDKRLSKKQVASMNDLDLYVGITMYWVNDDATCIDVFAYDEYYCTINRAGTVILVRDKFNQPEGE